MHINFQTGTNSAANERTDNSRNIRPTDLQTKDRASVKNPSGMILDLGSDTNAAYGFKGVDNGRKKDKKTDIMDDVNSFDAKNAHNYMAVMSNTMSNQDFKEMKEEGFHPGRMSEGEAVTNLDRIKVILSEAGVDVAGFTDTVDRKTAAEITGSEAEAGRIINDTPVDKELVKDDEALKDYISRSFEKADLPATDDNVSGALKAFDTAAMITPPDRGTVEYMLSNAGEPTIDNVYMAEHAGGQASHRNPGGYFETEEAGYYAEAASGNDLEAIRDQIDGVIEDAGLEVNKDTRKDAEYLIKAGFALNKENLNLYEDLKDIAFPLKAGDIMSEITEAVAAGKDAGSAYLIKGYNRIKSERVLNETRLAMNTEANRAISSDSGFSLETGELMEKVELLKEKERLFYKAAFSGSEGSSGLSPEESISLAEETASKIAEIKTMPAALAGNFVSAEAFTVNDIYEAGSDLKAKFEAANATYEAVGTEVRADLGDRIGDAFKSAAGLLKDIAFEETADNLRAVRILGYNGMAITAENVTRVKSADQIIRTLTERLTGAATVSLIKDGVNPLEMNAEDLINRISGMEHLDDANTKFSEYLFRLEKNHEISDEEAASYIGVYRLIRQIEKSDGAVIGALVNNGRELSLKNLLSELRTRSKGHMDISVDDEFGGITPGEAASAGMKIDTQIETAFRKEPGEKDNHPQGKENKDPETVYVENTIHEIYDRINPESLTKLGGITGDTTLSDILEAVREDAADSVSEGEELYAEEMTSEIREAAMKDEAVYQMLLQYGVKVTAENVNAMDALMNNRGFMFEQLINTIGRDIPDSLKRHSEKLMDSLSEDEDAETSESLQEAYGEMADEMLAAVREEEERAESYIDLRALQNLNRQLTVAAALSDEENYEIPMEINGRLTSFNLKIVRGTGENKAAVSFEEEGYGKVYAEFTLSEDRIKGFAVSTSDSGTEKLKKAAESMEENIVIFEKSLNTDINRMPEAADIKFRSSEKNDNSAGSGTETADNEKTRGGKDAGENTAILFKTVKTFMEAVR